MTPRSNGDFVELNKLICEFAYGRRMTFKEMLAYQHGNDCGPLQSGGNLPDPQRLAERYEDACSFILKQAEAGSFILLGRKPKQLPTSSFRRAWPSYPKRRFGDYKPIPRTFFAVRLRFGPSNVPVLWEDGESPYEAEWFFPGVTSDDAKRLLKEWRHGAGAPKEPSDDEIEQRILAAEKTRPKAPDSMVGRQPVRRRRKAKPVTYHLEKALPNGHNREGKAPQI